MKFLKDKIIRNKALVNGVLFSLYSFINRGFSFLLLLILANYISPVEYGYLSLFGTVVMVIGYIMAMSTEGYISVAYFREGEKGFKNAFSCLLSTTLIVASLLFAILFFYGKQIELWLDLPIMVLFLSVIIGFFTVFSNVNLDFFRICERVKIYGVFSCFNAFLNFVLSIIFVCTLTLGWVGRVYAQALCCVLFGIIGIIYFSRKGLFSFPNTKYWKTMLFWGIPLIPHLATNFIRQGCDRYIINSYHSIESVGLFSFALNLANIIMMVGMGFNQANSVDIYKVLGNKDLSNEQKKKLLSRQKKVILWIYIVTAFLITFFAYLGIPLLLPEYSSAMNYFLFLALYSFLYCVYFLYTNFLFYYKKTKTLMFITFGSSVMHLVLSLLLTKYSLYMTCSIYVLSQLLIVSLVIYFAKKILNSNLK